MDPAGTPQSATPTAYRSGVSEASRERIAGADALDRAVATAPRFS